MSGAIGEASEVASVLRTRLNSGLRQITFLVVPSVVWISGPGRRNCLGHLSKQNRALPACGCNLCLGNPGWFYSRTALVNARPLVLLRFLRSARHAHASAICSRTRPAYHHSRLSRRLPFSPPSRHRPALGRCRPNDLRRHRLLGRIHSLAARNTPSHRASGRADPVPGSGMDRGPDCGRRRARSADGYGSARPYCLGDLCLRVSTASCSSRSAWP